jgi:hypothetical protein
MSGIELIWHIDNSDHIATIDQLIEMLGGQALNGMLCAELLERLMTVAPSLESNGQYVPSMHEVYLSSLHLHNERDQKQLEFILPCAQVLPLRALKSTLLSFRTDAEKISFLAEYQSGFAFHRTKHAITSETEIRIYLVAEGSEAKLVNTADIQAMLKGIDAVDGYVIEKSDAASWMLKAHATQVDRMLQHFPRGLDRVESSVKAYFFARTLFLEDVPQDTPNDSIANVLERRIGIPGQYFRISRAGPDGSEEFSVTLFRDEDYRSLLDARRINLDDSTVNVSADRRLRLFLIDLPDNTPEPSDLLRLPWARDHVSGIEPVVNDPSALMLIAKSEASCCQLTQGFIVTSRKLCLHYHRCWGGTLCSSRCDTC